MKLTKTQDKILAHMHRWHGRYHAVRTTGHGPGGGKRNEGLREFQACLKLVELGVVEQVGTISYHNVVMNGWAERLTEITIKFPEVRS